MVSDYMKLFARNVVDGGVWADPRILCTSALVARRWHSRIGAVATSSASSHSRASNKYLAAAVAIGADACRARARGNGSLWQRPICRSLAS
eukprot:CAMPEP_0183442704 /NCGR_PEP_ID=MMETSP0370-20130417/89129_1 /TAXON_ID=268820 /ORGANISM="Peridinium aciculiferum, Strain PAER-2" /LENGTH=90 /DNA_ID=CAMNT_0025632419 /DNA_START=37 /DNA_END=306 /DNA_ORIENTATION=+